MNSVKKDNQKIPVLVLEGDPTDMGLQYGRALQKQLQGVWQILEQYFVQQFGLTHQALFEKGLSLYKRFPPHHQSLIEHAAKGANVRFEEIIIINGMLILEELLLKSPSSACAFTFTPPHKTRSGSGLIGRYFEYCPPFDRLASYLTVTVLKETHKIPVACIGIAGEMYCLTGINGKGLLMEINSGSPSGGVWINKKVPSMLSTTLTILQNSHSIHEVASHLQRVCSDYSLIVNTASSHQVLTTEYSAKPKLGMKYYYPDINHDLVITNFFTNPAWRNTLLKAHDDQEWLCITRRKNLQRWLGKKSSLDVKALKNIMDKPLCQGGALWQLTIYQIIFDTKTFELYIRITGQSFQKRWQKIALLPFLCH